jgi:hypothetical protein
MPSRAEFTQLRELGYTREEMAEHFGVPLSRIKRWLSRHGFARPERKVPVEPVNLPIAELPLDTGMTMMERAKAILGHRLTECRHRGYVLDGRVAGADKIIEAAGLKPVKRG